MQLKNKYQKDFEELKPKPMENIPTYKDLMKDRVKVDSVKVPVKPKISINEKEEKKQMMSGWKTWLGAFLLVISVLVQYVFGMFEVGEAIKQLAYLFLGIGIAHKIEKAANS